jgi:mycothiol system anti-sigma-R factor
VNEQPCGSGGSDTDGMGMDECEDAVHRLYHYLDGELTPERRAEVRRHLDDCSPCFKAFDFEADVRQLIQQRCRDEVPAGLRERIAQAIHHTATSGD